MARKTRKEEKKKRKLERDDMPDPAERLAWALEEVTAALADLDPDSSLHQLGNQILETLKTQPDDMPMDVVEGFLDRVQDSEN